MGVEIRWAKKEEWDEAMAMVWETFLEFDARDCTPDGIQGFQRFITDEQLKASFLEGRYELMVAILDGRVIGVGTLRNVNYLSLLFVDGEHHHQGIGRTLVGKLCDYLKEEVGEHRISLTASPMAVEFYKKLGFVQMKPMEIPYGIPVVSMEKVF